MLCVTMRPKCCHDSLIMHANVLQEMRSDELIGDVAGVGGEWAVLVGELRQLTARVRDDGRDKKICSEWKVVAMVVDRLCFCVFTVFFVIATIVVFRRQIFL